MKNSTVYLDKLVHAYTAIGASHYAFADVITDIMAQGASGHEAAKLVAQGAELYFERAIRPAYEVAEIKDAIPAKFEGFPQYKVAVDAIRYGSRLCGQITGYKITGNKNRVKFADWCNGAKKRFDVERVVEDTTKKSGTTHKDKGESKSPMVQKDMGTESKAAVVEQLVEPANWQTLADQAIRQAISQGELSQLVAKVEAALLEENSKAMKVEAAKVASQEKARKAKAKREAATKAHAAQLAEAAKAKAATV